MGTGDRPLGQVLDELDARLARVEAHLGLSPVEAPEVKMAPAAEAPPLDPSWLSHFAAVKRESALPGAVILPPAPPMQDLPVIPAAAVAPVRPSPPAPLPIIPDYVPTPSPRPAARAKSELEQTIGLKWSGWVGAVVVVIGVALGIKYAYDQNWFGILPPAARLALMSLAAFALIGAGEVVYRRIHVFAAACLYGAGVASLFLVSYAGFGYFRLYEQQTAFLLMALSTVAGAAVAMRGNFVSIAVLAQIGGNLAPLLLRSDNPRLVPFLAYLCTLQIVALALAWWGGRARWWTLRGMSLITTSLWLAAIFTEPRFASLRASKLTFCLIYAALFQAELVLSTLRGGIIGVAPPEGAASTDKRGVTFSMLVTALLTVA